MYGLLYCIQDVGSGVRRWRDVEEERERERYLYSFVIT